MVDFKTEAGKLVSSQVKDLAIDEAISFIELPPKKEFGNYSFPCFKLSAKLKKNPIQIAEELANLLNGKSEFFDKIEAFQGYLNFFVSTDSAAKNILPIILKQEEKFGKKKSTKKKIMVEYSQPNPNKPLHLGHMRNDSIGMAISNLLEFEGNKVIKANMINDRGIHICESLVAYDKFGKNETPKSSGLKGDKLAGKYYVLFHSKTKKNPELILEAQDLLRKWEKGEKQTRILWKQLRDWAVAGFKQTYKRIGSEFDVFYFESDYFNKTKSLIELGLKKKVFEKDFDGKIVAKLKKYGLPDKTVLRADGTSIYLTNDLIVTKEKFEKKKLDSAFWVVASEQELYFRQLFKILELLGFEFAKNCVHLNYGLVHLPEGKMKSREGKIIDADDLIDEVHEIAETELIKRYSGINKTELNKRAEVIALSAIKFFMLKFDAKKDFTFVPEESVSFEGESGPFLLYSYARAKSILRKSKKKSFNVKKPELLVHEKEKSLLMLLNRFPEITSQCVKNNSMHFLAHYLIDLASQFNSFYHELNVLDAGNGDLVNARLALVKAVSIVLKQGLSLLNISVLEQM